MLRSLSSRASNRGDGTELKRVRRDGGLLLLGGPTAGKTSIFKRLFNEDFSFSTPGTVCYDQRVLHTKGGDKLKIVDTAGLERFKSINLSYVRHHQRFGVNLFALVVDASKLADNLEQARFWHDEIKRVCDAAKIILILNKIDAIASISTKEIESEFSPSAFEQIFFVSARTKDGIEDLKSYLLSYKAPIVRVTSAPDRRASGSGFTI